MLLGILGPRPREINLSEFWYCQSLRTRESRMQSYLLKTLTPGKEVRRQLQPSVWRYQPREWEAGRFFSQTPWGCHPKTKKTKNDATCQFFWFVLLFQVFIDSIQEDVRQDILWTCSMITSWVFQCFLSSTYSASGFCLWMKGGLALSGTVQSLSSSWFGVKLHGWITF